MRRIITTAVLAALATVLCAQTELEVPALLSIDDPDNYQFIDHSTKEYGRTFCCEYYYAWKTPLWVAYQLHSGNSEKNVSRSSTDFKADSSIPYAYRVQNWMYDKTVFCRGHLCPSQDRLCSTEQNEQTFLLSNIVPQYPKHNTSIWKRLENIIAKRYNTDAFRDTLYIVKGPVYASTRTVLSYSDLVYPAQFFCAILRVKDGNYSAIAFLTDHQNTRTWSPKWDDYLLSVDDLEDLTGIDFFANLDDDIEAEVEASYTKSTWGFPDP